MTSHICKTKARIAVNKVSVISRQSTMMPISMNSDHISFCFAGICWQILFVWKLKKFVWVKFQCTPNIQNFVMWIEYMSKVTHPRPVFFFFGNYQIYSFKHTKHTKSNTESLYYDRYLIKPLYIHWYGFRIIKAKIKI